MGMLQERELRNNPGARSLFDAGKKTCALRACELPSEKRGVHPLLQPNAPPVKPLTHKCAALLRSAVLRAEREATQQVFGVLCRHPPLSSAECDDSLAPRPTRRCREAQESLLQHVLLRQARWGQWLQVQGRAPVRAKPKHPPKLTAHTHAKQAPQPIDPNPTPTFSHGTMLPLILCEHRPVHPRFLHNLPEVLRPREP
jgi:hypothetical protein